MLIIPYFVDKMRDYGQSATVPVAVLKKTDIDSIPYNFDIEVCESQSEAVVMVKMPAYFRRIGEHEFHVWYTDFL